MIENHFSDNAGNPMGGTTSGVGFTIGWQHGPRGQGEEREEPNGAQVEDVARALIGRLQFFQDGPYPCAENARAMEHFQAGIDCLDARSAARERQGLEGANAGHVEDPNFDQSRVKALFRAVLPHDVPPVTNETIETTALEGPLPVLRLTGDALSFLVEQNSRQAEFIDEFHPGDVLRLRQPASGELEGGGTVEVDIRLVRPMAEPSYDPDSLMVLHGWQVENPPSPESDKGGAGVFYHGVVSGEATLERIRVNT